MKTLQWAAAALAVGALALPARAETVTTNDWWDVTFELDSFQQSFRDTYPDGLVVGELGILTNFNNESLGTVKPYASGQWSMIDGDESYVTNGIATNWVGGAMTEVETATYVKLDTQGNDLTWTPTNSAIELTTLVDADLYLVGSDSAPDTDDFDSAKDVQAAIYLKNEIDEESGETTNSVLCVYVEHPVSGASYWQELKGVELTDNTWAHIQVMVDHSGGDPKVKVFVNGTQMTARDGDAVEWLAANKVSSVAAKKVNSVSFRGTGAVDNFAGKMLQTSYEEFDFSAEVYMNGTLVASDETGVLNKTQVKKDVTAKEPLTFEGFWLSNFDYTSFDTTATWSLSKIEIVDAASHEVVSTIEYGWDVAGQAVTFDEENDAVYIPTDDDIGAQTGGFTVTVPTAGATSETDPDKPIVLARIYFEDLPEEGQFKLTATQNVGTAPADQTFNTNSLTVTEATFTYAQTLTVGETSYVLSKVVPGTAPAGAITVAYESPNVVVTVPLTDQIAEGTYNVAAATYVEGTIAEGKLVKLVSDGQGGYDLKVSDPPVAIIVADSGATTNEYETLAAAVAAVPENAADATTITLVADITMSSSVTIPANKLVALDMAEHAITGPANAFVFGVLGELAVDGEGSITAMVPFYLGGEGALVVKSGSFTGTYSAVLFADGADGASVTVNGGTLTAPDAIGSSGKNVTIAVHGGTVSATDGCAIATNGSNGKGGNVITVDGGTIQAAITSEGYVAGGIHAANADTVTFGGTAVMNVTGGAGIVARGGTVSVTGGSITTTGDATGKVGNAGGIPCAAIVFDTAAAYPGYDAATSKITVSGGTFVSAVDPVQQVKAEGDATAIEVSGGWFSAPVAADFVAAGKVCAQDAANAPSEAATWTVEGAKVTVTWVITETSSNMVQVAVGSQVSAYAGEDVVNGTKKFKFWSTDGTTEASFPVTAEGNLTFFAVWEDAAVDPIAVTIGGDAVNALPANVEPITLDADGFTLRFAAKQTGVTYILQSATTVNGQFADVTVEGTVVSKTPTAVDQVVELTDPDTASTVKFFRVRVVVAE